MEKIDLENIRVHNINPGPHITHFSAVVAKKPGKILCFESSEHSVQTADDNKVTSQTF